MQINSFQSNNRETDLTLVKYAYTSRYFLRNDFIGPIGSYNIHFLSGAPPIRNKYITLTRPFDSYTWAFIIASLVAVTVSLLLMDKMQSIWTRKPSNDIAFKCKSEVRIIIQEP